MKKLFLLLLIIVTIMTVGVAAEEAQSVRDLLPEEISEELPEDLFSENNDGETVLPDAGYIFGYALKVLKELIPGAAKGFALILCVSIIASLVNVIAASFSASASKALGFIASLCVCGAAYSVLSDIFGSICEYLEALHVFISGFLPVMTGIIALSGNVTTAAVTGLLMSLALTLLEALSSGVLLLLLKVCFCFSVTAVIPGSLDLGEISALIKRVLTHVLTFIMLVMSIVAAYQTLLSKSSDSAILKGVRFAAGSYIPVIGNSIGESLNMIIAGMSSVRAATGAAGCAAICILLIAPLIRVIFYRLAFDLCSAISGIAGLKKEGAFMREISSLTGLGLAIMTLSSIFFMLLTVIATKI